MTDLTSTASLHYIVAATPRSGSTLLCELLKGTGIAGRPNEDFQALRSTSLSRQPRQFFEGIDLPFVDRLAPTDPGTPETPEAFAEHLRRSLAESTTPNGVYGTKVMWNYFDLLAERLATLPGLAGARLPDALAQVFPGLKFVQVQRRDKVSQAISLWTAVQTRTWRDEGEQKGRADADVFYSFDAIDHLVRVQTEHEDAWTHWLADHSFPVHTVVYEEFAQDPRAGVVDVVRWLGVPGAEDVEVPEPKMRRQRGGRSDEWAERYREDLAAREGASAS